jgi:hypothetical protein
VVVKTPVLPEELRGYDEKALSEDLGTLVAIREDGTILWHNASWVGFARDNGGDDVAARFGIGASYFEGISGALREFYERVVHACDVTHEPSPTRQRTFRMRVLPVKDHVLLVSHSLVVERPHEASSEATLVEDAYRGAGGIVTMCSNCRRTRRADAAGWDWVPQWVAHRPERVSHGICPLCRGYYYGAPRARARR